MVCWCTTTPSASTVQRLPSVGASEARNTSGRRHHEAQQGWEQGLIGEGVLSEAFEALSPSVGGDGGELGKEQAHLGLGERAACDEGEQEPVDAVELCGCERVLEVLEQCCDRVLFCRIVPFGCYHSG
jgi:hypothetical protein